MQEILDNSSHYAEIFKKYGLLCIRGANFSDNECLQVLGELANYFSWTPFAVHTKGGGANWKYTQNYDERVETDPEFAPDVSFGSLINRWHLEGMYKVATQHAAGWNMRHFRCDPSVGQTGFVDASELAKILPVEMLEFLRRATLIHYPTLHIRPDSVEDFKNKFVAEAMELKNQVWCLDKDNEIAGNSHAAIQQHPDLGCEVLRLCPCSEAWGVQHILQSVDSRNPTESELSFFSEIQDWLELQLDNPENQWWHEWREGDFVIPDLFVMIHGAKAGFGIGDREFDGFWCFPKGTKSVPDSVREIRDGNQPTGNH